MRFTLQVVRAKLSNAADPVRYVGNKRGIDDMSELTLTTFDWVPDLPRGYVRDLRIRWALEEAGLPYRVTSTPFEQRSAEHFNHQPFGQVPWLTDGKTSLFESGAILLYLGERSPALMPTDPEARNVVVQWLFAALNSVEMASLPWSLFHFWGAAGDSPEWARFDAFLESRLQHLEAVLADREWLARTFSIADIAMSDALRLVKRFNGLADYPTCVEYVSRNMDRPAFIKAYEDQVAHFAEADLP